MGGFEPNAHLEFGGREDAALKQRRDHWFTYSPQRCDIFIYEWPFYPGPTTVSITRRHMHNEVSLLCIQSLLIAWCLNPIFCTSSHYFSYLGFVH